MKVPFSPPDMGEWEAEAASRTIGSGWITTGPVNKEFEEELCKYIDVKRVKLLSSATSAMELALKIFGVGEGDEVIVPAYTYTSTANVVVHLGAKVVFIDAKDNDFNIDLEALEKAITNKTKAVIAVDIGGKPCDYDGIIKILESKKELFNASENKYQRELKRPLFLLDAAHSIGAVYKGKRTGSQADISSFSFHAVKNITTAEGGALSFNDMGIINADDIYKELSVLSLHGQSKSAFDKNKGGKAVRCLRIFVSGQGAVSIPQGETDCPPDGFLRLCFQTHPLKRRIGGQDDSLWRVGQHRFRRAVQGEGKAVYLAVAKRAGNQRRLPAALT